MSATVRNLHPVDGAKLKTPFAHLVDPLSGDERRSLEKDLAANGQEAPILIDEMRNILDGHHRYAILGDAATTKVIGGLTEAEKEALVYLRAHAGRNMSALQKKEMLEKMKATAFKLRTEDPQKNTQQRVADKLGVDRSTVAKWFSGHNVNVHNVAGTPGASREPAEPEATPPPSPKPDARPKYGTEQRAEVLRRVSAGEKQKDVSDALGIPPRTVSNIVAAGAKKAIAQTPVTRTAQREERDREIAKLYRYKSARDIAEQLGVHESCVRHSIKRQGLLRGKTGRKKNPLQPLENGLTTIRGQFMLWTADDAPEERDGAAPEQYAQVVKILEDIIGSARALLRDLKKEQEEHV